jgi:AhpD family alkylhydroperoxidase
MARLEPARLRGLDPLRRLMFMYSKRTYGHGVEPAEIIGHHRALLAGVSALGLASEVFARAVDQRLKHLAMLRTAQLIGCEWCLDFGSRIAHDSGVPEADLRELASWRRSKRFGERDRLVLEYVEAMTRTPLAVTDELFDRLRRHFDERQLVELTMSIAIENLYSRTNWALGIEGQGFSEGMYCVRPDVAGAAEPATASAAQPASAPAAA